MGELAELLAQLRGREFEHFIRDLWAARGWDTQLTSQSGDDGVDIVVERYQFYQQRKLIQAKCIQPDDNLSRSKVQQYSYLLHEDDVDEAILVTTGGFSQGARESAAKANLKLIDGETLEELVFDTIGVSDTEFDPESYVPEYDFESTTNEHDTTADADGPLSTDDGVVEPAEIPFDLRSRVDTLSEKDDIYERLLATIGADRFNLEAQLLTLCQLFRGDDPFHLLMIVDAGAEYRPLLDRIKELQQPNPVKRINCRRTDVGSVIGVPQARGGYPGLLSEMDDGLLIMSEFGENTSLQGQLAEPLQSDLIRHTNRQNHTETPVSASTLAVATPKYGNYDKYESIDEQVDLPPKLAKAFEGVIFGPIINQNKTTDRLPGVGSVDSSEKLDHKLFRAYRIVANNTDPTVPNGVSNLLETVEAKIRDVHYNGDLKYTPLLNASSMTTSLLRTAKSLARMQLGESVEKADIQRAGVLQYSPNIDSMEQLINHPHRYRQGAEFDADVVEAGKSKSDRDQIKSVKTLISDIEKTFAKGAPIEEVFNRASEIGMDEDKLEKEIEKLRWKGEIYEPAADHLRTT